MPEVGSLAGATSGSFLPCLLSCPSGAAKRSERKIGSRVALTRAVSLGLRRAACSPRLRAVRAAVLHDRDDAPGAPAVTAPGDACKPSCCRYDRALHGPAAPRRTLPAGRERALGPSPRSGTSTATIGPCWPSQRGGSRWDPCRPVAQCRAVFGVRIKPGEGSGPVRFRLSARAAGGTDRRVYETTLAGTSEAGWIDRVEAIPEFPGRNSRSYWRSRRRRGPRRAARWSAPHVVCQDTENAARRSPRIPTSS